ncbi:hypothetical protein Dimus_004823, partial [Dionaea muscipula]
MGVSHCQAQGETLRPSPCMDEGRDPFFFPRVNTNDAKSKTRMSPSSASSLKAELSEVQAWKPTTSSLPHPSSVSSRSAYHGRTPTLREHQGAAGHGDAELRPPRRSRLYLDESYH